MKRALGVLGGVLALACGGGRKATPAEAADGMMSSLERQLARQSITMLADGLEDDVLAAILAHPRVPELRQLDVGENKVTAKGVGAIVAARSTQRLEFLGLEMNPVGDDGLRALAAWPGLASIETLFVSGCGATPVGVVAFAGTPNARSLRSLHIGYQDVGDAGAIALAALVARDELDVRSANIGAVGARALISSARTGFLDLLENPVGTGGLVGLPGIAPDLRTLALSKTNLGPTDAGVLANLPASSLRGLDLSYNDLGDAGVRAIAGAPWLAQLESLDLMGTGASPEAYAALEAVWGDRRGLVAAN